ncbi:MAG: hypothetical protein V2J20_12315 [Wenzhouxiangella sp.]|jgi:hypothetical protein|nr:hypothetical protein [Wenzhouxiangella sp.]
MSDYQNQDPSGNVHPWPGPRADDRSAFAIPADQLEKLIARASVLEHAEGSGDARLLSEEEVISIGQEVGLSAEYVKRALAEYRAESLSPSAPDDHPLIRRIVGPAYARARRVVSGKPESVHRHLERLLTEQESLRARRQRGTLSVWEPNQSLGSKITRALDFEGRGYELSQLESLEISVAGADDHSSLVTLTADMRDARKEKLTNWASAPAIVLVILTWTGVISPWLGIPLLLASLLVIPVGVRWALDAMRRRNVLLLEGVLDQLEFRTRSRPD